MVYMLDEYCKKVEMKFFVPSVLLSAHVCASTANLQQVIAAVQQQSLTPNGSADGPLPSGFTPTVCAQWFVQSVSSESPKQSREPRALQLLGALEKQNCTPGSMTRAVNCALLAFIKTACGGDFMPSRRTIGFLDRGKSSSGANDDKRVTGLYVGTGAAEAASLKDAFEKYITESEAFRGTSIIKDTIQVEKGQQELSISAGTNTGDVSAFMHFTKPTNTLYVILYMGSGRTLEDGTNILHEFTKKNPGIIASSMVTTSREESKEARDAEQAAELSMRQSSQVASFALDLLCRASIN